MNQPVCPFLCRLKIYPAASLLRWIVAVKDTKFLTAAQKALVQASQETFGKIYQQQGAQGTPGAGDPGAGAGAAQDDNVVDADYEVVDDDKK